MQENRRSSPTGGAGALPGRAALPGGAVTLSCSCCDPSSRLGELLSLKSSKLTAASPSLSRNDINSRRKKNGGSNSCLESCKSSSVRKIFLSCFPRAAQVESFRALSRTQGQKSPLLPLEKCKSFQFQWSQTGGFHQTPSFFSLFSHCH